jgi:hypothetical protein
MGHIKMGLKKVGPSSPKTPAPAPHPKHTPSWSTST